ncbi:MAG: penicillin-binding transpeptidase domain-containing protein [Pseudomonadota bacterium]
MKRAARKKADQVRAFRRRGVVVAAGFSLLAVALVVRAVDLQVFEQKFLSDQADARHVRVSQLSAHRGSIVDRNGEPLAVSTPVDSVWAHPARLAPAVDELPQVSRMLGVEADVLMRRISRSADREFVYLKRHLPPAKAARVTALGLPGIDVQREYRRYYPAGEVTGHLIGFTNIDDRGQEGMEFAYDHWLSGEAGLKRVLRDEKGRIIEDVESVRAVRHGRELVASIDLRVQYLAYRELKRAIADHKAQSGSVVVLDIATGEVLAMVNQPGYNPNDRAQFTAARYRNRAVTDILEPGSSIKPIIVAAALQSRRFQPTSRIDTGPGFLTVGAKRIEDKRPLGRVSLTEIIARSSNVGITKLAMQLEPEQLWRTLATFGFGELSASGFPGESAGLLSHHSHWQPISQATLAYGYGISLTPLQLARAYAIIGAGGVTRPVSLLKVETPPRGERVIDETTANAVLNMMEQVIRPGGTGTKAAVPGYRVAGKTGTAWKFAAGGYSENKYLSIFAGVAPATAPRIAMVVVVDEPTRKDYYGGDVAAPVFARVMSESLRLLAVTPDAIADEGTLYVQAAEQ